MKKIIFLNLVLLFVLATFAQPPKNTDNKQKAKTEKTTQNIPKQNEKNVDKANNIAKQNKDTTKEEKEKQTAKTNQNSDTTKQEPSQSNLTTNEIVSKEEFNRLRGITYVGLILVYFIVSILAFFVFFNKKDENVQKNYSNDNSYNYNYISQNNLEKRVKSIEKTIKELTDKLNSTQGGTQQINPNVENNSVSDSDTSTTSTTRVYKYLKGLQDKKFTRVDFNPEHSFFRLFDEKDNIAYFEFCGDEKAAIANRVFNENIAIITSGNYNNATKVITQKPGKLKRLENGEWEVIEKIEINLEK